jgi:hypothetical protein
MRVSVVIRLPAPSGRTVKLSAALAKPGSSKAVKSPTRWGLFPNGLQKRPIAPTTISSPGRSPSGMNPTFSISPRSGALGSNARLERPKVRSVISAPNRRTSRAETDRTAWYAASRPAGTHIECTSCTSWFGITSSRSAPKLGT